MSTGARCHGCSALLAVRDGRLAPHIPGGGEPGSGHLALPEALCPASGTVPWRVGVPDDATVRALIQNHELYPVPFALFQVQSFGMYPGIVGAQFFCDCTDVECELPRVAWVYGFPADVHGREREGRIWPGPRWAFRPLDIDLLEPRPWPLET